MIDPNSVVTTKETENGCLVYQVHGQVSGVIRCVEKGGCVCIRGEIPSDYEVYEAIATDELSVLQQKLADTERKADMLMERVAEYSYAVDQLKKIINGIM